MQHSADAGCTFFDSAWAYGEGKSDQLLGDLLAANPGTPPVRRFQDSSRQLQVAGAAVALLREVFLPEHVFRYADIIRKNLGTDTIDLLQFHVWQDAWADEPDFRNTVEKLKRDGIIRAFGLSLNRWEPDNGIRAIRTGLVDAVQVIYNIFDQAPEDELFPLCREMNIGVIARVPLDEGSLGGNMTLDTRFPEGDWRARYFSPENLVPTIERVERLKKVLPRGHDPARDGAALCAFGSRRSAPPSSACASPSTSPPTPATATKGRCPLISSPSSAQHRWDRKPAPWSD